MAEHNSNWTTKELVHQAVRRRLVNDLPLRSEDGTDLVPVSKSVKVDWNHRGYIWRQCRSEYDLRSRSEFRMAKIDDVIGIGLFANRNLSADKPIEGANGRYGRHISKVVSDEGDLGVQREVQLRGNKKSKAREAQCYNLHGPLAFINHACLEHANCVPYIIDTECPESPVMVTDSMWKRLSTIRPIKKNEELTVCYDEEDDQIYPCRECKRQKK